MTDKKRKQPRELLDYDFTAERALGDDDTLVKLDVSYTGPDTYLVIEKTLVLDDVTGKVWISSGTDGATYKVTGLMTTEFGRVIEEEFLLFVKDR